MYESHTEFIRAIVREELAHRGFSEDPDEDRDAIRWIKAQRSAVNSAAVWIWRSLVMGLATGVAVAAWEGFKVLING